MEVRMAFNAVSVKALYVPNQGITLTAAAAAKAPLTGACAAGCVSYVAQNQSTAPVAPGASTLIPLQ